MTFTEQEIMAAQMGLAILSDKRNTSRYAFARIVTNDRQMSADIYNAQELLEKIIKEGKKDE